MYDFPFSFSSQAKKGLKLEGKDMHSLFATPELANEQVKLKGFAKFEDTTEALASATAAVEGKLSKGLKKFIKSSIVRYTSASPLFPPRCINIARPAAVNASDVHPAAASID